MDELICSGQDEYIGPIEVGVPCLSLKEWYRGQALAAVLMSKPSFPDTVDRLDAMKNIVDTAAEFADLMAAKE